MWRIFWRCWHEYDKSSSREEQQTFDWTIWLLEVRWAELRRQKTFLRSGLFLEHKFSVNEFWKTPLALEGVR